MTHNFSIKQINEQAGQNFADTKHSLVWQQKSKQFLCRVFNENEREFRIKTYLTQHKFITVNNVSNMFEIDNSNARKILIKPADKTSLKS